MELQEIKTLLRPAMATQPIQHSPTCMTRPLKEKRKDRGISSTLPRKLRLPSSRSNPGLGEAARVMSMSGKYILKSGESYVKIDGRMSDVQLKLSRSVIQGFKGKRSSNGSVEQGKRPVIKGKDHHISISKVAHQSQDEGEAFAGISGGEDCEQPLHYLFRGQEVAESPYEVELNGHVGTIGCDDGSIRKARCSGREGLEFNEIIGISGHNIAPAVFPCGRNNLVTSGGATLHRMEAAESVCELHPIQSRPHTSNTSVVKERDIDSEHSSDEGDVSAQEQVKNIGMAGISAAGAAVGYATLDGSSTIPVFCSTTTSVAPISPFYYTENPIQEDLNVCQGGLAGILPANCRAATEIIKALDSGAEADKDLNHTNKYISDETKLDCVKLAINAGSAVQQGIARDEGDDGWNSSHVGQSDERDSSGRRGADQLSGAAENVQHQATVAAFVAAAADVSLSCSLEYAAPAVTATAVVTPSATLAERNGQA
jgi:hypothetical protein